MSNHTSPFIDQIEHNPGTPSFDPTSPTSAHSGGSRDGPRRRNSAAAATLANGKKGARTLTEAQLEKKRANDRDAQRAIRERTKKQIEGLEQRIRDLESGEAFQQLQEALKQKHAVESENNELRQRLSSVVELLHPVMRLLPNSSDRDQPRRDHDRTPSQNTNEYRSVMTSGSEYPNGPHTPFSAQRTLNNHHHDRGPDTHSNGYEWSSSGGDVYRQAAASGPLWEPAKPEIPSSQAMSSIASVTLASPTVRDFDGGLKRKRPVFNDLDKINRYSINQPSSGRGPVHAQLPLNISPTCRLDTIVFDYATDARNRLAQGTPVRDIVGPPYPVFNSMVDATLSMRDHSMSELFIEVLKGFSAISGIPEKVGVISHMFVYMQWVINPTMESYEEIPDWARPVEEQLKVAHPIWIDFIPWPKMRAKMCYHYPQLPLDNFFLPYSTTLSSNFHSNDAASCLYRDSPNNDELRTHPDFEVHWRNIDNWSVGVYFAQSLPALADTCRIKETAVEEARRLAAI